MEKPDLTTATYWTVSTRSAQTWDRDYFCVNTFPSCPIFTPPFFPGSKYLYHFLARFITSQSLLGVKRLSNLKVQSQLYLKSFPSWSKSWFWAQRDRRERVVVFAYFSPTPVPSNVCLLWVYVGWELGPWYGFILLSRPMNSAVEGWLGKKIEEWQMVLDSIVQVVLLFL